jgi:hypothetical protein
LTQPQFIMPAVRPAWTELPDSLRERIERRLGSPVSSSAVQAGGFTHGVASRLVLADQSRVFAKAMPADDPLAAAYEAEGRYAARLPSNVPASRLRFWLREEGWIVLVFDDLEGRHPKLEKPADLAAVLATVRTLARVLTPSPLLDAPPAEEELAPLMRGWRTFAEQGPPADLDEWSLRNLERLAQLEHDWAAGVAGNTLLHADLRPDNMVLTRTGEIYVVDWACACVGAAWVDLAVLLGSVAGVDAEAVIRSHPVAQDVEPASITAFVCALLGCWERESRGPELPTSPKLRRFQARNARLTRAWLARRTGWR